MQEKKYYAKVESRWMQKIVSHKIGALAVHWVFQGLLIMDWTERWFKLGIDLVLILFATAVLILWLPRRAAITLGFLAAHTLNFLFNGQIYGVLKTFGGVRHSQEAFDREVARLRRRIAGENCIVYAAAYGSVARGEWSPTSDLDVRLVRAPGPRSAVRVCWFATRERARAFWLRFPLDLFVLDSYDSLDKLAEKHQPVLLGGQDEDQAHVQ